MPAPKRHRTRADSVPISLALPRALLERLDARRAPGQTRVGLLCYLLEVGLDQTAPPHDASKP